MRYLLCSLLVCGSLFSESVEHSTFSTIGTVCPKFKTTLSSVVSGRVEVVLVDVGDVVKKGQPLCRLETTLFDIGVAESTIALESARVEVEDAARNYERMKKLFEKPQGESPSISQKRYEDTRLKWELAQIVYKRAEQNRNRAIQNLKDATIKAPYDGVITRRFVHPGESVTVQPSTHLLEMVSCEGSYVEFSIPQLYRSAVAIGSKLSLEVEGGHENSVEGAIALISPDVDEKTRSIKCRGHTEFLAQFQPGSLLRVHVTIGAEHDPL